jgi:hypothetical protein
VANSERFIAVFAPGWLTLADTECRAIVGSGDGK